MAHASMYPLASSYFILFDASKVEMEFLGIFPTISGAANAAKDYIEVHRRNKLLVLEAEYGLLRLVSFDDVDPAQLNPPDPV